MNRTVIGVVGPIASGKGVIVHRLRESGFVTHSLSDVIRETADLLKLPQDRVVLQDIGDLLRRHAGNAVLAERTAATILQSHEKKFAIDSIRHPDEAKIFQQIFGARIIGVTASLEKRFALMRIRGRKGDPTTWEEFQQLAKRDLESPQSYGQQVEACLRLAEPIIENEDSIEKFNEKIESLLVDLGVEGQIHSQEKR